VVVVVVLIGEGTVIRLGSSEWAASMAARARAYGVGAGAGVDISSVAIIGIDNDCVVIINFYYYLLSLFLLLFAKQGDIFNVVGELQCQRGEVEI
jgi:uncharacterized spore protein YtfJ